MLVLGTQMPWLESILLHAGVGHITTLDYVEIECEHPNITTVMPRDFARSYLDGTLPDFDAVVTFSSVEHSGLGRWGVKSQISK